MKGQDITCDARSLKKTVWNLDWMRVFLVVLIKFVLASSHRYAPVGARWFITVALIEILD